MVDTQRPPPPWEKRWKCLAVDHRGCPPGGRATGDCFQRARGARHVAVDAFDRASGGRGRVCDSRQGPRIGSPGASETGREGTAHAAGCLLPAQQASPPLDEERAGLLPHSAVTRTRPHRGIQPRLLSSRVSPRRYACAGAELRPPRQTEYVPASARSRLRNWDRLLRSPLLQTHPASQPASQGPGGRPAAGRMGARSTPAAGRDMSSTQAECPPPARKLLSPTPDGRTRRLGTRLDAASIHDPSRPVWVLRAGWLQGRSRTRGRRKRWGCGHSRGTEARAEWRRGTRSCSPACRRCVLGTLHGWRTDGSCERGSGGRRHRLLRRPSLHRSAWRGSPSRPSSAAQQCGAEPGPRPHGGQAGVRGLGRHTARETGPGRAGTSAQRHDTKHGGRPAASSDPPAAQLCPALLCLPPLGRTPCVCACQRTRTRA